MDETSPTECPTASPGMACGESCARFEHEACPDAATCSLAQQAAEVMEASQEAYKAAHGYTQNGGVYLHRLGAALLRSGWRPPLPDWKRQLNEGIGIDDAARVYTEVDLIKAYSEAMRRERLNQAVEWGRRHPGGQVEFMGSERSDAEDAVRPGTEVVYRLVHPWKVDED